MVRARGQAGGEGPFVQVFGARELKAEDVSLELIRMAMMSVADISNNLPMQDILGLGEDARMNRPGSTKGNYEWRLLS